MSNFKGIQHVFFDLDHTLWDFDRNSKMAYSQIFEEEQLELDLEEFIAIYEPLNLKFWKRFRESEITKEQLRYQRLKDTFDACNYKVADDHINRYADLYLDYLPNHNHLFPNCLELLDTLKHNFELHIITNGFDEVQARKMENSGLLPYFKYVLTAETAGIKKPDPAIFERAMKDTGARTDNSVMIGDSYEADILGARNAGLRTIWFTNDSTQAGKESIVADLKEIQSLLLP
ncbi:putative hydrolase of the HAD superfamily [Nonlabens sp. Hel1_33_55]|uniref:YjjG family noncanonical pyrimidine nucleotidase n=1 Tax=Nonlabens sp. Hel1_33_55 TaxID=1336802 RepID=UPI000875CB2A|nr:YjjG family noncanonical pyrimidine nucleotidase [Nonlabens sp. Hel1_33_55]SCY22157.1 putative hydrolase of the HAD superfamily [Nonlabens sp. Hel1_33_55]